MKCAALLVCDRVIIDKNGAHSLINVMTMAAISAEAGNPPVPVALPPTAVSPQPWWIFTQWMISSADVGKEFVQHYQVLWPNGEKFAESKLPFVQQNDKPQQTTFFIYGLPVGQKGFIKIFTWLESDEKVVSEKLETYVEITYGEDPTPAGQWTPSMAFAPNKQ